MSESTKKYAVIQVGTVVYGIGDTPESAMAQAAPTLEIEDEDGNKRYCNSIEDVQTLINEHDGNVYGAIKIINSDDEQWPDYVNE